MASGERTIRIKFDGSTSGLTSAAAKARAELKALQKQTDTNKKNLDKFSSGVGAAASGLAAVALKVSALSGGINIIVGLTGALMAMSGVLGLLPAAGLAGIAAMLTLKLGFQGINRALNPLIPQLDSLKAKVSDTFQRGLAPAVSNLNGLMGKVAPGFVSIAKSMSGVAVQVTALAKRQSTVQQLNTILDGTSRVVRNVGAAFAPVIAAFIRVGAVAMPILAQLTSGIGAAAQGFNDWVQRMADTGKITQWIQAGIDAFKQLFGILGDLAAIVGDVFSAAESAGGGFAGTLGAVIKTVREFLDSAQGHDTLVAVFQALNTVGAAVSRVLGAALAAVAPVLPPLLDAFSQLATQAANFLVPAIQQLGPLLAGLATFLAQNMSWLGPIVLAVTGLVLAIQGLVAIANIVKGAIAAWTAVQWLLNIAMDANPIGLIVLAIVALIAIIVLIVSNLDFFRGVWDAVWKFVSDVITTVVDWFRNQWQSSWSWFTGLLGTLGGFFSGIWNSARNIVGGVISWFQNAWSNSINAVRGFFSGLASFAGGIWDGIVSGVRSAINAVIRVVNGAINGVNTVTGLVGIPSIPHIPMLAKGGTATSGRPYLVGEQGPELFTPGRTGRVTNATTTAEAMGGGGGQPVTIYLDLGEGISQVFDVKTDRNNRATVRALRQGVGASR